MVRNFLKISQLLLISVVFSASAVAAREYTVSMLPRYSTEDINRRVQAMAKYLNETTGLQIRPVLTSNFDEYQKQLANGGINIGLQNPYIYVLASKEHEVIAMVVKGRDGDKFRGIIITAAGSPISNLEDLRGKKISIVSYTSAGGYLSQRLTLLENNIDVAKECTIEVAPENKQENVMFSVFTGDVDAGFVRESALSQVEGMIPEGMIQVMTGTAWLPNWALSVSRQMPEDDKQKIIQAIRTIPLNAPVLDALKVKALRIANDSEYDTVRKAAGID